MPKCTGYESLMVVYQLYFKTAIQHLIVLKNMSIMLSLWITLILIPKCNPCCKQHQNPFTLRRRYKAEGLRKLSTPHAEKNEQPLKFVKKASHNLMSDLTALESFKCCGRLIRTIILSCYGCLNKPAKKSASRKHKVHEKFKRQMRDCNSSKVTF